MSVASRPGDAHENAGLARRVDFMPPLTVKPISAIWAERDHE